MKKLLCIIHIKNNIQYLKTNPELATLTQVKRKEIIDKNQVDKKCG
jgi:hypothetical protein